MKGTSIALVIVALGRSSAAAQKPVEVPAIPSCSRCVVELKPIVRLGSIDDPAGYTLNAQFAVAGTPRRYYATSSTFPGEIYQYDAAGKFVRAIGKPGEGPQEFTPGELLLAAGRGDSIHALGQKGRYHVIAPDGSIKRSTTTQARTHSFAVDATGMLFAGAPKMDGTNAFTVQSFTPAGESAAAMWKVPAPEAGYRFVAIDAKNQRWAASREALDITQWTNAGVMTKHFTAKRDWLANGSIPTRVDIMHERPPGSVAGLSFGADGNLYVFSMVADANWKAPVDRPDFTKIWDTLIEVIDPNTGNLVARTRLDRIVMPIGNGLAYTMLEDKEGDLRPEIYALSLKR
jgi:hypothetical protein